MWAFVSQSPTFSSRSRALLSKTLYGIWGISRWKKQDDRAPLQGLFLSSRESFFENRVFSCETSIEKYAKKEGARYLDVGCGNGRFLHFVKEQGMVPYGIDFFIPEENKELNIRKVHLLDAGFPDDYFDFITIHNVLEHVEDPKLILFECKRIVKKGGKILISVPNSSSLHYLLFSSAWVSLDPPRHLFTFSKKKLKKLCTKGGTNIGKNPLQVRTFWDSWFFGCRFQIWGKEYFWKQTYFKSVGKYSGLAFFNPLESVAHQ